jgi:ATP-dependent Clp endopeptidase proteolytic subunit ClpP
MHGARPLRSTRRLQNLTGVLPRWWKIENKATAGVPTLVSIYDEIGLYGVSAGDFLAEMREIPGDIELHLNSPGGDVFDGIAIYNQLKQAQRRGTVHVVVDGLAASAASFIAQGASPGHLEMAPHSQMMIHDGFAMGIGNAADMRELAEQLDKASDNIASIYADRTGKPATYWRNMMRSETWLSDAEAVSIGLADRIQGSGDEVSAGWDLSVYARWGAPINAAAETGPAPQKQSAAGDKPLGDGWVMGADGTTRFDPDGDGDDDSTPEGDTDHDYFDEDGKQIKPIPPCPTGGKTSAKSQTQMLNADGVDASAWDAAKAWHAGAEADDPAAFYAAICAGKRNGDPSKQEAWALPYRYTPDSAPNAAGVRAALARLSSTQGLINKSEAQSSLEGLMKKINPDYKPGDQLDTGLLSAVLSQALIGGTK